MYFKISEKPERFVLDKFFVSHFQPDLEKQRVFEIV